ncbi:thiamine-phosphate kinase [Sphingomonadaceae bacterium G21617-S1]|nr:thiamine-phosphate kinase [Sphingomonadaceae bacterium G21617-S1]
MSDEQRLIDSLRAIARHPAARGLADDAAVLPSPLGRDLVLTHDMLVEGVHYLAGDPPGDVAWKLLAVNLSDLAAKGAEPIGVLMGYGLTGRPGWDDEFIAGLARALDHFGVPLLGGDTVAQPHGDARVLGLTAIGQVAPGGAPDRRGAQAGDLLVLTGPVGDAGIGLAMARGEITGPRRLLKAYRLPMPRLAEGRALAPLAHAMADVSDGLLIDAGRIAAASGLAVTIDLDAVPLSDEARGFGEDRAARLAAVTAGDDYQLIAAVPLDRRAAAERNGVVVGRFESGTGLHLVDRTGPVPLPATLGYEHRAG